MREVTLLYLHVYRACTAHAYYTHHSPPCIGGTVFPVPCAVVWLLHACSEYMIYVTVIVMDIMGSDSSCLNVCVINSFTLYLLWLQFLVLVAYFLLYKTLFLFTGTLALLLKNPTFESVVIFFPETMELENVA